MERVDQRHGSAASAYGEGRKGKKKEKGGKRRLRAEALSVPILRRSRPRLRLKRPLLISQGRGGERKEKEERKKKWEGEKMDRRVLRPEFRWVLELSLRAGRGRSWSVTDWSRPLSSELGTERGKGRKGKKRGEQNHAQPPPARLAILRLHPTKTRSATCPQHTCPHGKRKKGEKEEKERRKEGDDAEATWKAQPLPFPSQSAPLPASPSKWPAPRLSLASVPQVGEEGKRKRGKKRRGKGPYALSRSD